jgi:hypothetical protein
MGTWRKNLTATTVTVTPQPFTALTPRQPAGLPRGIRDYGRFLGVDAKLGATTGCVSVRCGRLSPAEPG